MNHLNKAPGTDTNLYHSLLRKAKTGQASRCFIRGTSGHIRTVIKQELKRVSMGKAQSCSRWYPCRILEKGGCRQSRTKTAADVSRNILVSKANTGSRSQSGLSLAVWPWTRPLNLIDLNISIYKMEAAMLSGRVSEELNHVLHEQVKPVTFFLLVSRRYRTEFSSAFAIHKH